MFGSILSKAIKVATCPIDLANITMDKIAGGSGSKRSRNDPNCPNPLSLLEEIRDSVADTAEKLDD